MQANWIAYAWLLFPGASLAAFPEFTVTPSGDCGTYRAFSPQTGENALSLVVEFDSFEVSTASGPFVERNCGLEADVTVPAGMRFRALKAIADGEFFTSEQGTAGVDLGYEWMGMTCKGSDRYPRQGVSNPDNFIVQALCSLEMPFSECSDQDQQVRITGNFHLLALRGQQDRLDSDIALYNSEAISAPPPREHPKAVWVWDWQKCGDHAGVLWAGKTFQSKYQSPSGQWIEGTTTLSEDGGSYRTSGGQTGTLSGITYADGGQTARGTWRFQSGGSGWFEFKLRPDGKSFNGSWGYGTETGRDRQGSWMGWL